MHMTTAQMASILIQVGGIFTMIQGLKNLPLTKPLFDKHPKLAIWLNFGGNGIACLATLFSAGITDPAQIVVCIAGAFGLSLSTAGVHQIYTQVATPHTTVVTVPPETAAIITAGK